MKILPKLAKIMDANEPTTVLIHCRFCGADVHIIKKDLQRLPSLCCRECFSRQQALADGGARWPLASQRPRQASIFERLLGR
jgi:hypothetical protein